MAIAGKAPKNTTQTGLAGFADQGLEYIVGTTGENKAILAASITSTGTTIAVTFATTFGLNMKNTNYVVSLTADTGTAAAPTFSAKATTGFTISGVASGDVIDVLVVGETARQP